MTALSNSTSQDSYEALASAFHRRRLWAGTLIACALGLMTSGSWLSSQVSVAVGLSAIVAAMAGLHAVLRAVRPGSTALDSVVIDTTVVLVIIALLRPAVVIAGTVAVLYTVISAVLFLSRQAAAWVVAYGLAGATVVRWAFPPPRNGDPSLTILTTIFLLAAIPVVVWSVRFLIRSIDESRRTAADYGETSARFERLFHRSVVPMFRSTPVGRILDANPAMVAVVGAPTLDDLRAMHMADLYVDPNDRRRLLADLTTHGEIRARELRLRHWNGSEYWARMSALIVATAHGPTIEGVLEDITAEKLLARDSIIAEAVVRQVGSAVVVADDAGRVTLWNQAAEGVFGVTNDALGRPWLELMDAVDIGLRDRVSDHVASGGQWVGESAVRRPDGSERRVSASLTRINHDFPEGYALVCTDITDERDSQRRLAFQAAVLDQVHSAVVATDRAGTVVYVNGWARRVLGWAMDEALGRAVGEVVVEPPGAAGLVGRAVAAGEAWEGEVDLLRRSGETFPARVGITALGDDEAGGVVVVLSDVTARRRAEATARAQGELARSVLEAVHVPIAVVAQSGEIVAVNRAWTGFAQDNGGDLRRTGSGINYLSVCDLAAWEDPEVARTATGLRRVLVGRAESFTTEYPCHAPGLERWFRMEVAPIPGVGAVVAHWDITAERAAQHALERTVAAKDEFLAALAHSLRTPLTAVVGYIDLLQAGVDDPVEAAGMLDIVSDEARVVSDLVEDLLLVGRVESRTITLRPEQVDLAEVMRQVVQPAMRSFGRDIDTEVQEDTSVWADPMRVRQVLRNLVTNALRHGSPPIQVRASASEHDVVIDVIDHGGGAWRYAQTERFVPYTYRSADSQPATVGIGLYASQQLARMMGGDVTYRRTDDTTVFSLVLPRSDRGR